MRPAKMLGDLLGALFQKPATVLYPFERLPTIEKTRGRIDFDPAQCVGCKLCMRDCPSNAIKIVKFEGNVRFAVRGKIVEIPAAKKKYKALIRLKKCIYCGQCAENCLKKCLTVTAEFELATLGANVDPAGREV
jgi:NAD(P)H-quinone oxidoreductase subunit I